MNTQEQPTSGATTYAPRSIITATLAAIVVAALVFVAAILPAEYGSDPLGTGALLGLTALANGENPLEEQVEGYRQDTVEFTLEPFQSVEYKYGIRLAVDRRRVLRHARRTGRDWRGRGAKLQTGQRNRTDRFFPCALCRDSWLVLGKPQWPRSHCYP
jgi:hypothetical protein